MKFRVFLCISLTLAYRGFARNIEFPNNESTLNSIENTPVPTTPTTQQKCSENMELRPWNSVQNSFKCFCVPPFLPVPINNTCYEPFRQGLCEPGQFLRQLPIDDDGMGSRCIPNPCLEDGLVPYNRICHNITTQPLCSQSSPYFNESIFEIVCIDRSYYHASVIDAPFYPQCRLNGRKDKNGNCRPKL